MGPSFLVYTVQGELRCTFQLNDVPFFNTVFIWIKYKPQKHSKDEKL